MITKCVLNAILYHVGMSQIINPNDEMKHEVEKRDNQDWFNKGPCYNTAIC